MYKSLFLLLLALSIPLAIYLLPIFGFEKIIYKLDLYSPFWIFSLQFGLGLLLFMKLFGDFKKWIADIICESKTHTLIILLVIIAISIFISLAWIEGRSRVEADESVYLTTAQNLYHNQIGIHCIEGSFLENGLVCVAFESVKPRGLSYLYMLGMPIFGTDLYWVYNFHSFLLLLTLPIFFLALKAWTKSDTLSILSVALLASVPILLFQFRSASTESAYVFFFVLSLLFLKWAYDKNTIRHWLLLALTLAFFAQTRSETVFCLFAFIWIVFYCICINGQARRSVLSILNYKFSIFLATLSFFCLPILCTLSLGKNNPLQGGSHAPHGHLFENIVENFKIMALTKLSPEGLLQYPFFPYFTWLALFGLIALIILTIKEFRSKYPIPYKYITIFLLLLSPQYIILFDAVSADFNLTVQQRFILVVLPILAFLGALFLNKLLEYMKNSNRLLNSTNICILLVGIIAANTLIYSESFKRNIMYKNDYYSTEKTYLHNWLKKQPHQKKLLFHTSPPLLLSHGYSSYGYYAILKLNSIDMQEILEEYNGEVYIAKGVYCKNLQRSSKMVTLILTNVCKQLDKYFEYEEIESDTSISIIHRVKGLTNIDPRGLLRLVDFRENTEDSLLLLSYILPKKDSVPWKFQRYINNELIFETPYEYSTPIDSYKISLLEQDSNTIDFKIIDTITGDTIHKDYLKLERIRKDKK